MILSCVLPYYQNPEMLAHQYARWAGYPAEILEELEIVIVDDGSPAAAGALAVARPASVAPRVKIFRVCEDRPWHQHGARNLGAAQAAGPWLFCTDMDHELPAGSAAYLLASINPNGFYTFPRLDAPNMEPKRDERGRPHPHPNTFAVSKARYWLIGGYDERLCGLYGTDSLFVNKLRAECQHEHLELAPIVRYPREVIADASTRPAAWPHAEPGHTPRSMRDAARAPELRARILEATTRGGLAPLVLDFEWERVW